MKSISRTALLFASALLALAACSDIDKTQHGKAPENIGPITFDRTRIGAGQPVVATCPLPTGGENISTTEYLWQGVLGSSQEADGKSTYAFTAPTTPGEHSVTFAAKYSFLGPDLDGNIYKQIEATQSYTVVACDVNNSFWGDDLNETLRNCPSLQKLADDDHYGAMLPDRFSTNNINPPKISTIYTFINNALEQVGEEEELQAESATTYCNYFFSIRKNILSKLSGMTPVKEIVKWEDGTTEEFDPTKIKDDAYKARIGQGIMDHQAQIISGFRNSTTDLMLHVYTSEGKIRYARSYWRVNTLPVQ